MIKKDKPLNFFEHLDELRGRLIKCVVVFIAASCVVYGCAGDILYFLIEPVGRVVFTSPAEAFVSYMMLSLFGGLFLSIPYILYHIWQFVSVGLTQPERHFVIIFMPLSLIFFICGCAFAYFVMLPVMMKFFLSFASSTMVPMISVGKYISFVGNTILSFGIVFELPLVIAFLAKIGIATPAFLIEKRKLAVVLIFVVSALLTPSPDCVSQILMAIPLLILYELSIIFCRFTYKMDAAKESTGLS